VARAWYAAALRAAGDRDAAEEQRKALRSAVEEVEKRKLKHEYETLEALAYLDQLSERFPDALAKYEQVLAACPSCGWSARNAGEIYLKLGDKAKADSYLRKAAALLPTDQRTKELLK